MHDLTILRDLVILVAVAIPVVAIAQRLRVPTVVGFLLTGVVIGPHALRLCLPASLPPAPLPLPCNHSSAQVSN